MADLSVQKYLINYTEMAGRGELGDLIGREDELERLIHILLRTTKNNPVVVGQPGVGKTALIMGLAGFMASEGAPEYLRVKQVVGLNVAAIMLDTKNEEEYAELVKRTLQIVTDAPDNYLLYLRDISFLVNVDTNPENKEPAKYLKLSLLADNLNCIIETDTSHYVTYMEKDSAVMSHLQPLFLEEPTVEESIQIAEAIKHTFEEHYGLSIPPETVKTACQLAYRYVKQRAFPAKALDLLDDSASLLMMDIAKGMVNPNATIVMPEYCNRTIAEWTGIPVEKVDAEDKKRLANAEKYLKERVVGQDNAVVVVANAIRRARSGMQDPNRPIGSFLFIGTTGVGKTELAKSLADFMFNDETALLRLDMSEYMERSAVARMVGPAPGQPGYEQGGYLTESVRLKPFQVVLFDEVEKAHPDIMNLMLQLLDEGRLTDGKGVTVDFRNTIIILTSNVGATLPAYQRVDALTQYFRPEFLNRLDDIVSFHQLNEEHLRVIVDIHLNKLLKRAKNIGYNVVVHDSAKDWFVDEVFTSKFGVRALKRLIQNQVENPLSFLIMQEKIKPGQDVFLNVDKSGRKLQIYTKTVQKHEEIAPIEMPPQLQVSESDALPQEKGQPATDEMTVDTPVEEAPANEPAGETVADRTDETPVAAPVNNVAESLDEGPAYAEGEIINPDAPANSDEMRTDNSETVSAPIKPEGPIPADEPVNAPMPQRMTPDNSETINETEKTITDETPVAAPVNETEALAEEPAYAEGEIINPDAPANSDEIMTNNSETVSAPVKPERPTTDEPVNVPMPESSAQENPETVQAPKPQRIISAGTEEKAANTQPVLQKAPVLPAGSPLPDAE